VRYRVVPVARGRPVREDRGVNLRYVKLAGVAAAVALAVTPAPAQGDERGLEPKVAEMLAQVQAALAELAQHKDELQQQVAGVDGRD
jgi:hypothetical protein